MALSIEEGAENLDPKEKKGKKKKFLGVLTHNLKTNIKTANRNWKKLLTVLNYA